MSSFGLIKSFHIDNGELDELTNQHIFVLGYELADIDHLLTLPEKFDRYVHAENQQRVRESCEKARRKYRLNWMEGDVSETWMWLEVERA